MAQITAFGKEAKKKLIDHDWNISDLAIEVTKRTGMFCDQAYLSRIFNGERNAPKIREAVCEILDIKEDE